MSVRGWVSFGSIPSSIILARRGGGALFMLICLNVDFSNKNDFRVTPAGIEGVKDEDVSRRS